MTDIKGQKRSLLTQRAIKPRLITNTIGEPTIRSACTNMQGEIECLVEGCSLGSVLPRVGRHDPLRSISDRLGEITAIEEGDVESEVDELMEPGVNVNTHEFGRPFHSVSVEAIVASLAAVSPEAVGVSNAVQPCEKSPLKGSANVVYAPVKCSLSMLFWICHEKKPNVLSLILRTIPTGLHEIDFTRQGPCAISVFHWQHEDRGPKPVSSGQFCANFNLAKLNVMATFGRHTGAHDRIDDRASREIGDCAAGRDCEMKVYILIRVARYPVHRLRTYDWCWCIR